MASPAPVVDSPRCVPINEADSLSSVGTPTWRSPAVRLIAPGSSIASPASPKKDPAFEAFAQAMAWDNLTASVEHEALHRSLSRNPLGLCAPKAPCSSDAHCCASRQGDEDTHLLDGNVEVLVQSPVLSPIRRRPEANDLHPVQVSDAVRVTRTRSQNGLNLAEEISTAAKPEGPRALTQSEIDEIVDGLKDDEEPVENQEEDCNSPLHSPGHKPDPQGRTRRIAMKSPPEGTSPVHSPGRRQKRRSPGRRSPVRQSRSGAGQTCGGSPRRRSSRHNDMIVEISSI